MSGVGRQEGARFVFSRSPMALDKRRWTRRVGQVERILWTWHTRGLAMVGWVWIKLN